MTIYNTFKSLQTEKFEVVRRADRYLDLCVDLDGPKVEVIISPTGTGKTEYISRVLEESRKNNLTCVILNHRVSLSEGTAKRLEVCCYLDSLGEIKRGDHVVCLDSVERLGFDPDVIVIDECDQVAAHSLGKTIKAKNACGSIHVTLKGLCAAAKKVIAMSATLERESLEHVLTWTGREEVRLTINESRPADPLYRIYMSAPPAPTPPKKIKRKDLAPLTDHDAIDRILENAVARTLAENAPKPEAQIFSDIYKAIRAGHTAIACSTVADAQAIGRVIEKAFPEKRVACVVKDSAGTEDYSECLKNPNLFKENFDVLVYSPVMGSGVNITDEDTWSVFGFIKGYNDGPLVTDALQQINRIRYPKNNVVGVLVSGQTETDNRSITEILADLRVPSEKTRNILKGRIINTRKYTDENNEELLRLLAKQIFLRNRLGGRWNPIWFKIDIGHAGEPEETFVIDPGQFVRLLQHHNYRYEFVKPEIAGEISLKETKKEIKVETVERIVLAEKVPVGMADELEALPRTPQTSAMIQSAKMRDLIGKDELDAETVEFLMGQGAKKTRAFAALQLAADGHAEKLADTDRGRSFDVDKINEYPRATAALRIFERFGIDLNNLSESEISDPDLKDEDFRLLRQDLNMKVKSTTGAIRILRSVADHYGIKLKIARVRDGVRFYKVDSESVARMRAYAEHEIKRRLMTIAEKMNQRPSISYSEDRSTFRDNSKEVARIKSVIPTIPAPADNAPFTDQRTMW